MVSPSSEIVSYRYTPELERDFASLRQGDYVEATVKTVPTPGRITFHFVVTSIRKVDEPSGFAKEPKWNGPEWGELKISE
jgi:hypothetical protein